MKDLISPIEKKLLEKELNEDTFLRKTNKGNNYLFVVNHENSPNVMQEIGRLRELTFRASGGGTGKSADIDNYDVSKNPYQQLIVWDPDVKEILGGYRYIIGSDAKDFHKNLATSRMFNISDRFIKDYLSKTIELGRSFVQPDYQSTKHGRKSLYALDNLWDGLGALIVKHKDIKYLLVKVTMYPDYNSEAKHAIIYFLDKYFGDRENLLTPVKEMVFDLDIKKLDKLFSSDTFADDYKILSRIVRINNEKIPPLINAYMNLSSTMKVFGTSLNDRFGDVEETGIMITIADLYDKKVERHIESYTLENYPGHIS